MHRSTGLARDFCAATADAVIVGGGPAGALTAYLLARQGRRVVLLEAAEQVQRKICGEYLCPRGAQLLDDLGLRGVATGRELVGMRVVSPEGRVLTPTFPPREGRPSVGLALNREVFERNLLDRAAAAGATVLMGRRLRAVKRTPLGWQVRFDHAGATHELRAALLVGADGRRSVVARELGLREESSCDRIALHGHFHRDVRNDRFGEMHLLADGSYIGVDPTGDHEVNVSLVCSASRVRALGGPRAVLQHYLAKAADYHRRYGAFPASSPVRAVSPITHRVSAPTAPGAALVGDAAGFLDPLTGEGMFWALWGAHALAEALSEVRAFDSSGLSRALRRYARTRRDVVEPKWRLHRGFRWLLARPHLIESAGRFFARRPRRADAFLGIIGNIYGPLEGLARTVAA